MHSNEGEVSITPEVIESLHDALYLGDRGRLPLETRRVFVHLLMGPSLDAKRHAQLWNFLLRDEAILRQMLSECFMELVIDPDSMVAFIRKADTGDIDTPSLLRNIQLTFIDSALLLFLRDQLAKSITQGERAVVDAGEILQHMLVYDKAETSDRAIFVKRVNVSIEKLRKYSFLHKIRNTDDRFEISPALKLIFSVEHIQALTALYRDIQLGKATVAELQNDAEPIGDSE